MSVLLEGAPNAGKTALAASLAKQVGTIDGAHGSGKINNGTVSFFFFALQSGLCFLGDDLYYQFLSHSVH